MNEEADDIFENSLEKTIKMIITCKKPPRSGVATALSNHLKTR